MSDKSNKGFSYVRLSTNFTISRNGKRWKKFAIPIAIISIVTGLLAIAAVALSLSLALRSAPNCQLSTSQRFDCLPGLSDPSSDTCVALGCCWDDSSPPFCYHSSESGYAVDQDFQHTAVGVSGCLARKQILSSTFGQNVHRLCVNISFETDDRLHIKVYDPNVKRYEVPLQVPQATRKSQNPKYTLELVNDTFSFAVSRKGGSKTEIFRVAPGLVFTEQFIQLSAYLPSPNIYGLGEHVTNLRLPTDNATFTLFAADIFPNPDLPGQNLYGVHPFYVCLEESGKAHGVLLLNSNAMDVTLQHTPSITYRTIGGILDLYFFMGPSPEQVIQQYTEVIGRSMFPPYWSLGFHLCRWGYDSANTTWNVVRRMRELAIPQDVQWSDIDYMHDHLDFSYDHKRFAELPEMVEDLHQHGQKYVVITDPGISNHEQRSYEPYNMGLEMNVFVRNLSGGLLIGRVWPNLTVYPDFLHPNASTYWQTQIQKFHENISFDGLWIDMNEPSNFETGSVDGCDKINSLDNPPYLPASLRSSGILHKTLCMSSKQYPSSHYNLHSLYGHSEAQATMNALEGVLGVRSLVISRSTFVGSGCYSGHWLGDNASQWKHMVNSIPGMLHFSLFGIPLVGADICGFFDHPSEELCVRWQQLGAFYPFSRNHNIRDTPAQDPTVWSERAVDAIRDALLLRYTLLPYLYTLFYFAHVKGSTVARPLFFEFPSDRETWDLDSQFLWGNSLLVSPVLEEGASVIHIYLPIGATWFQLNSNQTLFMGGGASSGHVTLPVSLLSIPVHIRGGSIIPIQSPNTTTSQSRRNPFSLIVALDENSQASGNLFADNGDSVTGARHGLLLSFNAGQSGMSSSVDQLTSETASLLANVNTSLAHIYVLGLPSTPSLVILNNTLPLNTSWDSSTQVLMVNLPMNIQQIIYPFVLTWNT